MINVIVSGVLIILSTSEIFVVPPKSSCGYLGLILCLGTAKIILRQADVFH